MIVFYYFSPRVTRSVVYGPRARNTLDLYLPRHHMRDLQDPIPVVIYLTGAHPRARGWSAPACWMAWSQGCLFSWRALRLRTASLVTAPSASYIMSRQCLLMSTLLLVRGSQRRGDAMLGGAWIIGYKAWGSLLARRLSRYGVIVCCLDYRNFPQARIIHYASPVRAGRGSTSPNLGSRSPVVYGFTFTRRSLLAVPA